MKNWIKSKWQKTPVTLKRFAVLNGWIIGFILFDFAICLVTGWKMKSVQDAMWAGLAISWINDHRKQ